MTSPIDHLNDPATQLANIPGSTSEAVAHGQNLVTMIQSGNPADMMSLASAGISFASSLALSLGGPQYQQVVSLASDVLGGALEGGSVAGPYGAALGAVAGLFVGLPSLGEFVGVTFTGGVSQGTEEITRRVLARAGMNQTLYGNPQGWAMADWCATAYPPHTSGNEDTWRDLVKSAIASDEQWFVQATSLPLAQVVDSFDNSLTAGNEQPDGSFSGAEQPLATPVWWNWSTPSASGPGGMVNVSHDLFFGSGGAGKSVDALRTAWVNTTQGLSKKRGPEQIVEQAILRRPDPLFWGVSLYGRYAPGNGPTSGYTTYRNPDGINGMATILGMNAVGASPMSMVAELSIQLYILSTQGKTYGSAQPSNGGKPFRFGNPSMPGGPASVDWSMAQARATLEGLLHFYATMARALAQGHKWNGPQDWATHTMGAPAKPNTPQGISSSERSKAQAVAAAKQTVIRFVSQYLGR